jgi:hypothetical protein
MTALRVYFFPLEDVNSFNTYEKPVSKFDSILKDYLYIYIYIYIYTHTHTHTVM